jgi:alpha-mannosidase
VLESKTNPETPCDKARYEKICHKYIDLSTPDNNWGLAILNEGKYAFDVNGGSMKLTMLRACKFPSPAPEAWVNIEREENEKISEHKVPVYSGLGPFACRYALLPHEGGALKNANNTPNVIVKRRAEEFNKPVIVIPSSGFKGIQDNIGKFGSPIIETINPNISLEALKFKEWDNTRAIIIRLVESSGAYTNATITFSAEITKIIKSVSSVDLLERSTNYDRFYWDNNNCLLSFEIGKFEILTFELVI